MEGNFSSYADYEGNFNLGLVHAIVQFSGAVSLGATISIHNSNYDTLTGGQLLNQTFDVAVQVTQVTTNGFTFTTLPGHVLYPATITFAANSSQAGSLQFAINVNGMFANRGAEIWILFWRNTIREQHLESRSGPSEVSLQPITAQFARPQLQTFRGKREVG